jgi:hypothetical protein
MHGVVSDNPQDVKGLLDPRGEPLGHERRDVLVEVRTRLTESDCQSLEPESQ